jgi:hypothetical protein
MSIQADRRSDYEQESVKKLALEAQRENERTGAKF